MNYVVCFRIYDLNGDRYISKEEMFHLLRNCLVKGSEEDEDGVKDLVDLVLKKLDEDRDGRVSEADWMSAIAKEGLLMEAFGQCLPSSQVNYFFQYMVWAIQSVDKTNKSLIKTGHRKFLIRERRFQQQIQILRRHLFYTKTQRSSTSSCSTA